MEDRKVSRSLGWGCNKVGAKWGWETEGVLGIIQLFCILTVVVVATETDTRIDLQCSTGLAGMWMHESSPGAPSQVEHY